jgi:tripartite-type tricarboxylate transporter receptor subunit TctC
MRHTRRPLTIAAIASTMALLFGSHAKAEYPDRTIQVVVPFAGGSASDVVTRIMLDRMGKTLGQTFIVDNRPGAGGNIGTSMATKAAPDGYTLLMSSVGPLAANRTLFKSLGYDQF